MILDSDPETRKSGRKLQKSLLTESEWELIKELIETFRQFDLVTTTLSGRDFLTLSLIVPLIFFLKKRFLELVTYYMNDENYDNEFENENIEPIDSSELLEESGEEATLEMEEDEIELL